MATVYSSTPATNIVTRAKFDNTIETGSGRDLLSSSSSSASNTGKTGYWGLSGIDPARWILVAKDGSMPSANVWNGVIYSTGYNSNFTLAKSGVDPDGYNFIEDFSRFELGGIQTGANSSNRLSANIPGEYELSNASDNSYTDQSSVPAGYDETYPAGVYFLVPVLDDQERDTIYVEDHGLQTGSTVTLDTTSGSAPVLQTASSSITSAPSFTTLADPQNIEIIRVSANRIRLRQANVEQRVRTLSGSYTITVANENPNRNSVYLAEHGLSSGQLTTIEIGTGGVLPGLTTSVPTPTLDGDLGLAVLNAAKEALDAVKVSMGGDGVNLYINGTSVGTPFVSGAYTFAGGSYDFSYGMSSIVVNFENGLFSQTVSLPTVSSWSQESPYDYMSNTQWSNSGFNLFQSKYEYQQEAPYWITLVEIPASSSYGGSTIQVYPVFNSSTNGMPYAQATTNNNNDTTAWISLSNGWRYTHDGVYFRPDSSSSGRHGFFRVSLILDNSNYSGYLAAYNQSITNSSALHASSTGYGGQRYLVDVLLPIKAGASEANYGLTSGTIASVNAIASGIANQVVGNLVAATYSNGVTSAYVKVINNNRFSLKTLDNIPFDFLNHGTSPLLFNLGTDIGGLDGSYSVKSKTDYSFSVQAPLKVPARFLSFTHTDISNNNNILYFNFQNHSLDFGQAIEFSDPSGTFTGLTDSATYYAIPADANYFAIAPTLADALTGSALSIAAPASGSYSFSVATINGLIPRSGTVDVEASSSKITGSEEVLFKQFFKDGDSIFIVNNSTTPGSIQAVKIASVVSNSVLNLAEPATFTANATKFLTKTAVYMRPDGTFLHRPFDGGVEITAGSSPNSSITRQTRKYFRYQSGKGIQCSIAINFNPARPAQSVEASGLFVTVTTRNPHGFKQNDVVTIRGAIDSGYNGTFAISSVTEFTFTYAVEVAPQASIPAGVIEYVPTGWTNAAVRCGMFDEQNGFFYEYDGQNLYAVRRSSVQQLSGTVAAQNGSNLITGTGTNFLGQLSVNDKIVIRGQTYKVTAIENSLSLHIQPTYRGISQSNIIVTRTIDTRVPQSQWNLDKADGTGPSNFNLDITKIQMTYMDYSWYGAGKIRFGFKDTKGKVRYFHEFIHNNTLNEAYMRSGNLPACYQIENTGVPSYVPTLFHWGTSVIMDGQFDDDKAYLFTASSNSLNYSSGTGVQATTAAASSLVGYSTGSFSREREWYVKIPFSSADAGKFGSGTELYSGNILNGEAIKFTDFSSGQFNCYIYVGTSRNQPSSAAYPSVPSGTVVNIGAPVGGSSVDLDLLKSVVPIVTIRLAPSVDNNLSGAVGQRDIINRMQLQLKQLGITTSHDCDIQLILNGSLSNINYEIVQAPSLSQLIKHTKGDTIVGGTPIFSLRASGGVEDSNGTRLSNTVDFDLSQISDLGNSILGGDGVFPNGPDILTIAAEITDTTQVTTNAPFLIAGRLTWTESQA